MTREEALKYLDTVAESFSILNDLDGKFGVATCEHYKDFQIHTGIWSLCKALEIEPEKKWRSGEKEWNIEVTLNYRNIRFFELCHADIPEVDLDKIAIQLKAEEKAEMDDVDATVDSVMFKEMDKVIEDFDKATTYSHADNGVLGEV